MNGVNQKAAGTSIAKDHYSAEFSAVATRLVEAARFASDGNGEAAKAQIARAMALLHGEPSTIPSNLRTGNGNTAEMVRGSLPAWKRRRLTAYIETHLADTIRVQDLAELLDLSESHFKRTFRAAFGTSAHDYVTRRRIEAAQGLMLTTSEGICTIALRCGLSDQSHFTRVFRRIVGETPAAWRRMRSGEIPNRRSDPPRNTAGSTHGSVLAIRSVADN